MRFLCLPVFVLVVLGTGLAGAQPSAQQAITAQVAAKVAEVEKVSEQGPFKASWRSLETYEVPSWYQDAKFGIFIHWGAYSVPAFGNEWYPRNMYQQGSNVSKHHVATYGPPDKFGYKDFIPLFKAAHFNADEWAELFSQAGARFVVPVAEHHDGFPMYDSAFTDWDAKDRGPQRDIVGELEAATRKRGMHFGVSSHRAEHWWFFDGGRSFPSDVQDPAFDGLYGPANPRYPNGAKKSESQPDEAYLRDWLARTAELVDKYKPELVWFDWWIEQPAFVPYLQKFTSFYYNRGAQWNKGVAINYKKDSFPAKAAVLDIERGKLDKLRGQFWQTDTSISLKSWGYIENDEFRTADSLIDDLVDIVSKNGALLLNVGPKADGTIPEPEQQVLRQMGDWLKTNGEAIYDTRPWTTFGEGPTEVLSGGFTDRKSKPFSGQDIRFTTKGNSLYAIALAWPGNSLTITSITPQALSGKQIARVELLGVAGELRWAHGSRGLDVTMPEAAVGEYAHVLRIQLQ